MIHDSADHIFQNVFEYAAIGMALVSTTGQWLRVNRALCGIFGYSAEELRQLTFQDMTHPDDLETDLSYVNQLINGEIDYYAMEKRYYHKHGHTVWVLLSVSLIRDEKHQPQFFISQLQDITERIHAVQELRDSQQRLELALEGAELGTWDWNIKTGHVRFNERWAEMLGYTLDDIEPNVSAWEHLIHPDDKSEVMDVLSMHLRGETAIYETRHRVRHKNGNWLWILDKGKVIQRDSNGEPLRACGTHLDITERIEYEQKIIQQSEALRIANDKLDKLAHIDSLTNLYNRRAFTARLNEETRRVSRNGQPLSLVMLDIDDFKSYNDTFGHPEGDILLQQLANVIQHNLRANDIAARTGGEEFSLILTDTNAESAIGVADKLRHMIAGHPWDLRPITASLGITTRTFDRHSPIDTSSLISEADTALYRAKRQGKNRVCHFSNMDTDSSSNE